MRLGVPFVLLAMVVFIGRGGDSQDVSVQADDAWLTVEQVEVLEGLGQPEGLHLVGLGWGGEKHVVDGGVGEGRGGVRADRGEHVPAAVGEVLVGGDAPQDEDGLDGFGAVV